MSRSCDLSGKIHQTGHNVSHSNIKTKRRFMVNLNRVTLRSEILNKNFRFRVAASTLRTVDKYGGLDGYLLKMNTRKLTDKASKIKKLIEKNSSSLSN